MSSNSIDGWAELDNTPLGTVILATTSEGDDPSPWLHIGSTTIEEWRGVSRGAASLEFIFPVKVVFRP